MSSAAASSGGQPTLHNGTAQELSSSNGNAQLLLTWLMETEPSYSTGCTRSALWLMKHDKTVTSHSHGSRMRHSRSRGSVRSAASHA